jgi:hypothetical protein
MVKCVKQKSESVIHIWVTEGSEESIIFIKFTNVAISTTFVGQFVPQHLPPTRLWKMVLPDVLHCLYVHRHASKFLKT